MSTTYQITDWDTKELVAEVVADGAAQTLDWKFYDEDFQQLVEKKQKEGFHTFALPDPDVEPPEGALVDYLEKVPFDASYFSVIREWLMEEGYWMEPVVA